MICKLNDKEIRKSDFATKWTDSDSCDINLTNII
jgi:hypothetical protein